MAVPGIGTIVVVDGTYAAVVAVTAASWKPAMAFGDYAIAEPASDEVYVHTFALATPGGLSGPYTEGTGSGHYALPSFTVQAE